MNFKGALRVFVFALFLVSCADFDRKTVAVSPTPVPAGGSVAATGVPVEILDRPSDGMPMVYFPAGTFWMGSTLDQVNEALILCEAFYSICNRWYYMRESPDHKVSIDSYWLDRTEVTNAQYRQCVEAGGCEAPTGCQKGEPPFPDEGKADHPVVCTTWQDAQRYCQWVGARLPTEAEWEYAARGAGEMIYPWGDSFVGTNLNYCDENCSQSHADARFDDGYAFTAPVGSYPEGESWGGILNMAGNVSEWVADWYGEYASDEQANPGGPQDGKEKLIKGCSWFFHPAYCRGAARPSVDPGTRFDYLGFRCAANDFPAALSLSYEPNSEPAVTFVSVPSGTAPTIDGMLSPGEWDQAWREVFADGSELLMMYEGGYLYLAIRSSTPDMIVGNVHLNRGDKIVILHTSAALGTGIYEARAEDWELIQGFSWCCRDTSETLLAQTERETLLLEEGWISVNSRIGIPNELEYQIEMPEKTLQIAVTILRANQPDVKIPWPADLADDSLRPTPGGLPDRMDYSPEAWITIMID